MKKIKVYASIGRHDSGNYDEFEVPDDMPEEEIEEIAKECAFNMFEWWYDIE
ncbi:MAG: hypothetical protein LBV47_04435 [Bacteroidales bacterium]|jgi:hypothetical protein|nr:hypothetical protein [Bacteroidales bacterium]